jgi:hypothetical protein
MKPKHVLWSLLLIVLVLAGCAPAKEDVAQGTSETVPAENEREAAPAEDPFLLTYNGTQIVPGEPVRFVLDLLGEAQDVFEAPSCAFEGVDRMYYYPGIIVNTYPASDGDRILAISFRDDSVQTDEGVYLGNSAEEVSAIYGEGESNEIGNVISFRKGDAELRILFENDEASDITYYYTPAQENVDAHADNG